MNLGTALASKFLEQSAEAASQSFALSPHSLLRYLHQKRCSRWRTTRKTARTGRPRRRSRILEIGIQKLSHMRRLVNSRSRRRVPAMYEVPTSCLCIEYLTLLGQRKAPTCPARRPPARRGPSHHRGRRWSPRCWKNHFDQISDSTIHETNPLDTYRTPHSSYIETAASHIHRMSGRFPGEHDRYRESGGYCAAYD